MIAPSAFATPGKAYSTPISRCLARQPRTLLLDEPSEHWTKLPEPTCRSCSRDTGAATVLVTHDIDEALLVSDRVVLLGARGTLIEQWTLDLPEPREDHIEALGK